LLADDSIRRGYAERMGVDEQSLVDTAVLDPAHTVATDVERVRQAPEIPDEVRVSGHVYDLETGLVTTVVPAGR
jgi:carbonic anhydrase